MIKRKEGFMIKLERKVLDSMTRDRAKRVVVLKGSQAALTFRVKTLTTFLVNSLVEEEVLVEWEVLEGHNSTLTSVAVKEVVKTSTVNPRKKRSLQISLKILT